jgi:hypothetical protein
MTELKNAGVDVTPEVSPSFLPLLPILSQSPRCSSPLSCFYGGLYLLSGLTFDSDLVWAIQNLQNMMGSIGEPGQAGDDVGGRKK